MPTINFNVTIDSNADEVREALHEQVEQALIAIGMTAETYAKEGCPVDTGRLRNSISHDVDDEAAYIGTNVEYGKYVELGTSRMSARPFLGPAAQNHSSEYRALVESALKS